MVSLRRLLVISHIPHFRSGGRWFAYGPYVREIDIWADLFPELVIAAPLRREAPPGDSLPFTRDNISMSPQIETGGERVGAKIRQVLALPGHCWRLGRAMGQADAIHVRCPGNLGLVGTLVAPWFRKPRVAKYAGQWSDYPGEARTWRWLKALLRSRWWGAPVLVYGLWPNQPPHIVPFFASVMEEAQMAKAREAGLPDWSRDPLEVLFVGRLSPSKNVDVLIRALALLKSESRPLRLRVVGDGPVRGCLEALVDSMAMAHRVLFEGPVRQAEVLHFYARSHILVLASETEGWPKAIAEGMAFGLVCIGTNRGFLPQMLADGRGLTVPPGEVETLAERLRQVVRDPLGAGRISQRAAAWARQFTLEDFRRALRERLELAWGVSLAGRGGEGCAKTRDLCYTL